MYVVCVGGQVFAMDRERSPRRSSKDYAAQSQMSWMNQERPMIMQPNHLQWSPNPVLIWPFGGLWGQSQAPPPPAHAQQHTAMVPYRPPAATAGGMSHGKGSGQQTPWLDLRCQAISVSMSALLCQLSFLFQVYLRVALDPLGQVY